MSITHDDLRAAVPDFTGATRLKGLEGPVEIVRDTIGVPHVRARSVHDAFFAQGYVHAQDRLWQMESGRRGAYGRWAEYVGRTGIAQDTLMRRLRLGASARTDYQSCNDETRAMLDSYALGINAFIETTPILPVEYRVVGGTPEPWRPWDCCALYKFKHALIGSWMQKIGRAHQLRTVGVEALMKLRVGTSEPTPVITSSDIEYRSMFDGDAAQMLVDESLAELWAPDAGSNNWAVHGSRTESGKPLLAGDPHRLLDVPNVYYQNHLTCPAFDVIGFSFAGVPGFPHFGHNARVAWCITHVGADAQDLFIERFAPGDPTRYEYQGKWLPAERTTETIHVRDADPVDVQVTVTHHGPVIVGDPANGYAVAIRYIATATPDSTLETILPMVRARSVAEFDNAMRGWGDPCNNLVMADVDGAIGYLTRGRLPIRNQANAWLPVPGWSGAHEWQGEIPFDEMPRARNPDAGYIVTANNRIVRDGYSYHIALDYAPGYRAERIIARLQQLPRATAADMAAIHSDALSLPSRIFVGMLEQVIPTDLRSAEAKRRLLAWDGTMGPDDVAAAIYAAWREQTLGLVLAGPVLRPLTHNAASGQPGPRRGLLTPRVRQSFVALMHSGDTALLAPGEAWPTLLAEALARATGWLAETLGPDMAEWRWSRIHRTGPKHNLAAAFPEIATLLNPPSVGVGGDADTPQAGGYGGIEGNSFTVMGTSVARYVFDLADWDRSGWIVPLGSSGHPGSTHYADQMTDWSEQRLSPMRYTQDAVNRHVEARQYLEPDNLSHLKKGRAG
jgi:penicillin G amidase